VHTYEVRKCGVQSNPVATLGPNDWQARF